MKYIILFLTLLSNFSLATSDQSKSIKRLVNAIILKQDRLDKLQNRVDRLISADGHWLGEAHPSSHRGPTGVKGPQGPQGVRGEKGDTGNKGADSSAIGKRGDRGDKGPRGDQGPRGRNGRTY